jgi:GxxExxY protein
MAEKLIHKNITQKILQSFFAVNKALPNGLSAEFYGNALEIEFKLNKLNIERNYSVELIYRNKLIGSLIVDFLIEQKVLVKIVSSSNINKDMVNDAMLLLRESGCEICMILNSFGDNDYKRVIFSNEYKTKKS